MKIRPVGAESFHEDRETDGRTDTTKLIIAFRNSANSPKQGEEINKGKTEYKLCNTYK